MDRADRLRWKALLLGVLLALSSAAAPPGPQTALPAAQTATAPASGAPAEMLERKGLPNLGRVSENLYRGGQPESKGYDALRELGIQIVFNFRDNPRDDEQQQVESRGMRYVEIPWSGFESPDNHQVVEFLRLLRDNADKKIYVHCRRGAERTGLMVAAFRIALQGWTAEQALDEMERFKFRGFWFRHLKNYVRRFPEQLKTDPTLQQLQPAKAAAQ